MRRFRSATRLSSQPELVESAARRNWAPSALLVVATIAIGVSSYGVSMQVATERRNMEKLERQNAGLAATLGSLEAELRVRMRLPQLQSWNDNVLGLVPISATQYLDAPMRLAAYASAVEPPALPQAQFAVRDLAPRTEAASGLQLRLIKTEAQPVAEPVPASRPPVTVAQPAARPPEPAIVQRAVAAPVAQRVTYLDSSRLPRADTAMQANRNRAVPASAPISRPQEAPADLLAQLEVAFSVPPGRIAEP